MIFSSIANALSQLGDPRFRNVLAKGIGLTMLLLGGAYAIVFFGVQWLLPDSMTLPFIGEVSFIDTLLSWASLFLMLILSIFLMVPVASAFTGLFLDEVADAVEERHYAHLPQVQRVPLADAIRESLGFLGVLIVANLAALILYFTPLAPFVFYGLNGFLLGREYFGMIAVRREGRAAAKTTVRKNLPVVWATGTLMAVPLTVPLLNLLVPVIGVAAFTHLYHALSTNR